MKDQSIQWKDIVLTGLGLVLVFGLGAYFGFRVQEVKSFDQVATLQAQVIAAETNKGETEKTQINPIDVPEVFWLAPGGQRNCPETHPVKGKFTSTGNVVYAPESKSYNRVTAHICMASIQYAVEKAGFFEKKD